MAKAISPALADVVALGFNGFDKREVIKRLPVKKSQAYSTYDKAERLSREYLRK